MTDLFDGFTKKKDFLVCIDSDGCAMDTMDIKHIRCFGPAMVEEWQLEPWEETVLKRWNEINLYTMTRGINRFKGLVMALQEIHASLKPVEGLPELLEWAETAGELSNGGLKARLEKQDSEILRKALHWSCRVNELVEQLPKDVKQPFEGVKACLEAIHEKADVAIVSSANQKAIEEEWTEHDCIQYTDILLSQNAGSKAFCISRLLEKGYDRSRVLMVGDAPGDRDAAAVNGVLYYPILVKKEGESWRMLFEEAFSRFLEGTYAGAYQEEQIKRFEENLL